MKIVNNYRKEHNYMVVYKIGEELSIEGWHNAPDDHWKDVMGEHILSIKRIS